MRGRHAKRLRGFVVAGALGLALVAGGFGQTLLPGGMGHTATAHADSNWCAGC